MPTPEVSIPLDIPHVRVLKTRTNLAGDYIITVESRLGSTHCRKCGREISKFHGHDQWVKVRHLPLFGRRVYLRYRPKRYACPYCDGQPTTTEVVDWHAPRSPHTKAYDRHLLLQLINATVEDVRHPVQSTGLCKSSPVAVRQPGPLCPPLQDDELLAQECVFGYQVSSATRQVSQDASDDSERGRFCDLPDLILDLLNEYLASIQNGIDHDYVVSNEQL